MGLKSHRAGISGRRQEKTRLFVDWKDSSFNRSVTICQTVNIIFFNETFEIINGKIGVVFT